MVVEELAADCQKLSFRVKRCLHVPNLNSLLHRGREAFEAVLHPLDWRSQFQGYSWNYQFLGMEYGLGAEAAADIRCDHAHLFFTKAKCIDEYRLGPVRHLRAIPNGQQVVVIDARHDTARLHRVA